MRASIKRAATAFLLFALVGCGLLPEVVDETRGWSVQKLYAEAKSQLGEGNYARAIELYETIEARYPYGRYAQQAQIEVAYAYFKDNEPISSIAAADRFLKLHPDHPNADYVYYLKGLVHFNEDLGFLGNLTDQDLSERDPKAAQDAFVSFKELATRFPNSKYAPDAAARMKYLVNALAFHEVHVARYYFRREAYVAAANRAQTVVKSYPQSPAVEDALAVMTRAYDKMGMTELRDDAARVLKLNYPNSVFLTGAPLDRKQPWWKLW
jgi:outer membrane protein assembly factor BamD